MTLNPLPLLRGVVAGVVEGVAAVRKAIPAKGDTAPADVAGEADALLFGLSWNGDASTVPAAMGSGVAEARESGDVNDADEDAEDVDAVEDTVDDDETRTGGGKVGAAAWPLPLRSCACACLSSSLDAPLLLLPLPLPLCGGGSCFGSTAPAPLLLPLALSLSFPLFGDAGREFLFLCFFAMDPLRALRRLCEEYICEASDDDASGAAAAAVASMAFGGEGIASAAPSCCWNQQGWTCRKATGWTTEMSGYGKRRAGRTTQACNGGDRPFTKRSPAGGGSARNAHRRMVAVTSRQQESKDAQSDTAGADAEADQQAPFSGKKKRQRNYQFRY